MVFLKPVQWSFRQTQIYQTFPPKVNVSNSATSYILPAGILESLEEQGEKTTCVGNPTEHRGPQEHLA